MSTEEREKGFSPSSSPPIRVPNLFVGSLPSRRNLNSARYPALARDALLSSGRFTFDTVTLVDLPTLPSSHSWTPIPGLRRIVFNELPLIGEGSGLATWFQEVIALQPELTAIVLELFDEHLPEDSNPERMAALSLIPWFSQVAFMSEQLATKHSNFKGLKIVTTKAGIVAATIAFCNTSGIAQWLQGAALSIPTLTTLDFLWGLEYPAWNDVLLAMSSFKSLTSLTIGCWVLPWKMNSRIQYCDHCCDLVRNDYPHLWEETQSLGGPVAVWESKILPSNLLRIHSLANVLPNDCTVVWSPIVSETMNREPTAGSWRWKVARGQTNGGILREEGRVRVAPRTLEQKGVFGGCWGCELGTEQPDEPWDLSKIDDWDVSSEDVCEGSEETQEWA